jgi:hypothetical protein
VAVDVDPTILQEYTGRYELAPSFVIDVSVQDGRLTAQLTGQQRFPLYAESDSEFFYTVVDAQITFVRNEAGDVDELVLHQGGRDQQAKRIQ